MVEDAHPRVKPYRRTAQWCDRSQWGEYCITYYITGDRNMCVVDLTRLSETVLRTD